MRTPEKRAHPRAAGICRQAIDWRTGENPVIGDGWHDSYTAGDEDHPEPIGGSG